MKWFIVYKGEILLPHAYKTKEIAEVALCCLLAITVKCCKVPFNPMDYTVSAGEGLGYE